MIRLGPCVLALKGNEARPQEASVLDASKGNNDRLEIHGSILSGAMC